MGGQLKRSSWGGVEEEVGGESELVALSVECNEAEMAVEVHLTSTYTFMRTSTPAPTHSHSSSPSSSSPLPPVDFPPELTLPFAQAVHRLYAPVLHWPSIPAFVVWLSRYYSISPSHFFPLCHLLRFTSSHSSLSTRRSYVCIRLLTYQLLMTFSSMRKELLHFFMYSSPTLLDDLIQMIREEDRVPTEIRSLAWLSLTQFSSASSVRGELKQLGLIQQSVLLACCRNAIGELKRFSAEVMTAAMAPPSAPPIVSLTLNRAAATCSYAESILSFIERLSPRSVYEPPAINPVELVELMLGIVGDPDIVQSAVLMRATAVIEGVLNSAQSQQVVNRFHAINGLDICMQRIAAVIRFTQPPPPPSTASSSSTPPLPPFPLTPLVVAAPSLDASLQSRQQEYGARLLPHCAGGVGEAVDGRHHSHPLVSAASEGTTPQGRTPHGRHLPAPVDSQRPTEAEHTPSAPHSHCHGCV